MNRLAGWLVGAVLLAAVTGGCGSLSCSPPAATEAVNAEAVAAEAVHAQALALYRGDERRFFSEQIYDTIIMTLREGVQRYPGAPAAPKLQLMLGDMAMEKIKYLNKQEMNIQGVSMEEAVLRARGSQTVNGATFNEALRRLLPYTEALAAYEMVYTRWPQSEEAPQALYKLADLYCAPFNPQRDPARGLGFYQKLVAGYPQGANADWALYSMANTYREIGDVQQAVASFRQLLKSYPDFPAVQAMTAQKYIDDHSPQP